MSHLDLDTLAAALDDRARTDKMNGVVSVDVDGSPLFAQAYGLADRAHGIANDVGMRFGMASASKAFTALAVMSLVEDGTLQLDTAVRGILGGDLPLIADDVTVEHLLSHTSGIGDYLDEDADWEVDDYVLTVPLNELAQTEAFVRAVDGFPQKSAPGEHFTYNNGGFIVLAIIAERASGMPFHDLVSSRVFAPAGLEGTGFLRLDELPGDAAIGYVYEDPASLRSNVLHLPVRGNGDGGAFTTAADLSRLWRALADGAVLTEASVAEMWRPRHTVPSEGLRYGLGFWLDLDGPGIVLEGYDAGVSIRTRFDPETRTTVSIVSNTSEGAWGVIREYADRLKG
ncbi:serine hydrolase domain-containing protein [Microbacterium sp. CFBP9034]|uniref:serine hydrolase domain-containing protein n=1 Tax=Microbacterium sp. CFBP9034 TaxID=3096540 RepID=UPI002A6AFB5B|nr:serine hydrolase domain-containing protein [Microbacterium sp. CFBP9034]MDY0909940.1 serine hydrolase domain-containing protein [Microbacterium sp. CFBP9034]